MRILSTAGGTLRHGLGAVAEAAIVVAIAVTLVFGVAVVGRHGPAGAADVYAAKGGNGGGGGGGGGGSLSATISFSGYASQPLSISSPVSFVVTRTVLDNTVYWVYNYCWDDSENLLSTEAYPVLWGMWDSYIGSTYDFTLSGTHCRALVTIRSWTAKPLGDAVMDYAVAP
jgi:hypothetical protein